MDKYREQMEVTEEEENADNPDPPEWDGSEAELVADDDAPEYEEQQTGFKLCYTLREQEVLSCLKTTDLCKTSGKRAVVETVLLTILFVTFLVSFFFRGYQVDSLVFAVICALLMGVIWIVPKQGLKNRARQLAGAKEISVEIYPDSIDIGEGEGAWSIPLDGTAMLEKQERQMVVHAGKNMLILPFRAIEPAVLPEIQAMIVAGTSRYQDGDD